MPKPADLNRCLAALDQDHTIIVVIEMSQSSWLVAGVVPGIARHPLKKLVPDQDALLSSSIAGVKKRAKPAARSAASLLPLRPAATASG